VEAKQAFMLLDKRREEAFQEISKCINSKKKTSLKKIYSKGQAVKVLKSEHGTMLVKLYPTIHKSMHPLLRNK